MSDFNSIRHSQPGVALGRKRGWHQASNIKMHIHPVSAHSYLVRSRGGSILPVGAIALYTQSCGQNPAPPGRILCLKEYGPSHDLSEVSQASSRSSLSFKQITLVLLGRFFCPSQLYQNMWPSTPSAKLSLILACLRCGFVRGDSKFTP